MNIKIGTRIKTLRKRDGVTQEKLADALGVTPQAVSKWESETGYPDLEYLTPIANFEPFAEVLENERKTWLSDILVREYPCVTPDAPAVAVAGEMTRYQSSRCYVREGEKLVGVVFLTRFLSKLFRE